MEIGSTYCEVETSCLNKVYMQSNLQRSEYVLTAACFTRGIPKEFMLASFAAILLPLCRILNNCQLNISASQVIHRCHLLGTFWMASLNHCLRVIHYHSWTSSYAVSLSSFKFRPYLNTVLSARSGSSQPSMNI